VVVGLSGHGGESSHSHVDIVYIDVYPSERNVSNVNFNHEGGHMNWESAFQLTNLLAMAGWAILIFGPRQPFVLRLVPACLIPALLSAGYFVLVAVYFAGAEGGYSSLAAVGTLFASEPVRLAGWVHYLAFDLFVGAWIARRADEAGISRIIQAPILAATFLFGPVGLLVFLLLEAGTGLRRSALAEGGAR
jgi:hypothetical protein